MIRTEYKTSTVVSADTKSNTDAPDVAASRDLPFLRAEKYSQHHNRRIHDPTAKAIPASEMTVSVRAPLWPSLQMSR
jgi:hypothetical protein